MLMHIFYNYQLLFLHFLDFLEALMDFLYDPNVCEYIVYGKLINFKMCLKNSLFFKFRLDLLNSMEFELLVRFLMNKRHMNNCL
jgi:hypothetical protein